MSDVLSWNHCIHDRWFKPLFTNILSAKATTATGTELVHACRPIAKSKNGLAKIMYVNNLHSKQACSHSMIRRQSLTDSVCSLFFRFTTRFDIGQPRTIFANEWCKFNFKSTMNTDVQTSSLDLHCSYSSVTKEPTRPRPYWADGIRSPCWVKQKQSGKTKFCIHYLVRARYTFIIMKYLIITKSDSWMWKNNSWTCRSNIDWM